MNAPRENKITVFILIKTVTSRLLATRYGISAETTTKQMSLLGPLWSSPLYRTEQQVASQLEARFWVSVTANQLSWFKLSLQFQTRDEGCTQPVEFFMYMVAWNKARAKVRAGLHFASPFALRWPSSPLFLLKHQSRDVEGVSWRGKMLQIISCPPVQWSLQQRHIVRRREISGSSAPIQEGRVINEALMEGLQLSNIQIII